MSKSKTFREPPSVKISYSFLKILTGSDLSLRRLPLMSAVSVHPGPVVWLTACGHGDEVGGIVIIQEVFKKIKRRLLNGSVHAFPLMNPIGFETVSRNITVTREDLNRSFPGDPKGSLGERIAHRIFDTIMQTNPSLVIDLHNDWIESIPYTLIDRYPGPKHKSAYDLSKQFARKTGFCSVVDTDELIHSLTCNLLIRDVPALTLELSGANVVDEKNVTYGIGVISNLLSELKMIESQTPPFDYPMPAAYSRSKLLRYSDKPFSSKSGIVRFLAGPGDEVKTGQPLARIVNAFGKHLGTIVALENALVLGHADSSVVFPGMPIMAFGLTSTEH